ncbi:MAG: YHS domain-containing protein [Syntrophobacterales bacterium]|jgi:hypothetical protein
MKKIGVFLVTLALTLAPASVMAQSAQGKPQTVCPVLEGNPDKNIFVDYKGQRIYFCCEGCDAEFNKDPEKYLKKMEAQGITPEKSPADAGKSGK